MSPTIRAGLPTFNNMEACSHKFIRHLNPPGEVVEIPYENGKPICGYFVRAPFPGGKTAGADLHGRARFHQGRDVVHAGAWRLQRGISVLMIDGPGQGGTLRRHKIVTRADYEVPIGKCIDWLGTARRCRSERIAVCGSSLGGYYAARAGCYEHRLAAAISHGAIWSVHDMWGTKGDDFGLADAHQLGVRRQIDEGGARDDEAVHAEGPSRHMNCPYLVVHGGHDVLTRYGCAQHLRLCQGARR